MPPFWNTMKYMHSLSAGHMYPANLDFSLFISQFQDREMPARLSKKLAGVTPFQNDDPIEKNAQILAQVRFFLFRNAKFLLLFILKILDT